MKTYNRINLQRVVDGATPLAHQLLGEHNSGASAEELGVMLAMALDRLPASKRVAAVVLATLQRDYEVFGEEEEETGNGAQPQSAVQTH